MQRHVRQTGDRDTSAAISLKSLRPAQTPEQRAALLEWASIKSGAHGVAFVGQSPYEAFGVVKGDTLVGVIFISNFRGCDAEVSVVGSPGWLSRRTCSEFFHFCFTVAGLARVTAFVPRRNKRSRALVERLGFMLEGVRRKAAYEGRTDMIMYGLLAQNCRWL